MTAEHERGAGAPPIVLLAFDRPDYFEQVLDSLAAQQQVDWSRRDLFLFLDGARNRHSGRVHADSRRIDRCEALFRRRFPRGTVFRSPDNLGVWRSFERAERFVFQGLGAEIAYFFEDDLVLSPWYLRAMDLLGDALRDRAEVAYFAAYGDHRVGLAEQEANASRLTAMQHHWGFALKRRAWQRIAELLEPAGALLRTCDYRLRPQAEIRARLAALGIDCQGTSQDFLKADAAARLGFVRLRTVACWGRYIGQEGLHFNAEIYRQLGFHETVLYPRAPVGFEAPDASRIAEILRQQQGPKPE